MTTSALILNQARELFNQHGIMQITLRDVAAALNKSYGNITYHFAGKAELLAALIHEYEVELANIGAAFETHDNLFVQLLQAPQLSFEVEFKYRFLLNDFLEIQRNFPELLLQTRNRQQERMTTYLRWLQKLQRDGYLRPDLPEEQLQLLMKLSGLLRTFYFMQINSSLPLALLKKQYCHELNALLWPYLTPDGQQQLAAFDTTHTSTKAP